MKNTKPDDGFRLSNLTLLAVIGILATGIFLDGILYNKAPVQTTIYPITDAQTIAVQSKNQSILQLKKAGNQWLQTHPVAAPALSLRVQPLLDTNKYNQRSYVFNKQLHSEIFADAITLTIDDAEFQLGSIEPVSNLRYVRSSDQVYLQPDTVVPMLSAVDTVFVDLKITNQVERITISDSTIAQPATWSDLMAIGIVDITQAETISQPVEIKLVEKNQTQLLTAQLTDFGYTITTDKDFTYLLSSVSAETLGLADLLLPAGQ